MKNLILVGEGFGGLTAITTSIDSPKIKAAVALNPWLDPLSPAIKAGRLNVKQPLMQLLAGNKN